MREDKSLKAVLFLAIDIKQATPIFTDGLGYSALVSYMDNERVVFEALLGVANEDRNHTRKMMH